MPVGRHTARPTWGAVVQVDASHIQRITAHAPCHRVDDGLDHQRTLGAAEATKGGIALGVGAGAEPVQLHRRQTVGIVEVAQGAGHHRRGQVGRIPCIRDEARTSGQQTAIAVEAHLPVDFKGVTTACDHEVVVSVHPQLHRPQQAPRGDRRHASEDGRLRFLAPKTPAHASAFHLHPVRTHAQRVCHQVLHLAGVLRGAVHLHALVFLRHCVADLALQVELLLAPDDLRATKPMRRLSQCGIRITASHAHGWNHILPHLVSLPRRQHGCKRLDLQRLRSHGSGSECQTSLGGHHCQYRLPQVLHHALGQDGVVLDDGAALVVTRNVFGAEYRDHAGLRHQQRFVDRKDAAMRHRRQAKRGVQGACEFGQIVYIGGLARHVQAGRLMRK